MSSVHTCRHTPEQVHGRRQHHKCECILRACHVRRPITSTFGPPRLTIIDDITNSQKSTHNPNRACQWRGACRDVDAQLPADPCVHCRCSNSKGLRWREFVRHHQAEGPRLSQQEFGRFVKSEVLDSDRAANLKLRMSEKATSLDKIVETVKRGISINSIRAKGQHRIAKESCELVFSWKYKH
ncbi:nitrogen fixation S (NIFS)-like 1 [Striga asiatica]|uniref:Nitrogen fixation S (NIFS)-like 1 n=1 Tax=Striga asiatica TaxID=4170 RepID=A0A5A7PBW9_STRAF|nr:nitrogen fixation S (NIFS)-like 1 [Striga asiatica]